MKARRFVNVVTADSYLLSRIKLKNNLFYPSAAEAQHHAAMAATSNKKETKTAAMMTEDVLRLPPSKLRLKPSSRPSFTRLNYMPFYGSGGGGEGNVLCADDSGNTALYDADADTLEMMPGLTGPKGCRRPISFSVARGAGTLYILDRVFHSRSPTPSRFEALVYDNPNPNPSPYAGKEDHAWHWRPLPPPPVHRDSFVGCHALLHGKDGGGGTIYVSYCTGRDHVGTYRFDTGTGEWTKAGDWRLPFFSQGVHVPELGEDLLFGIELHDPYRFCAMDIASCLKMNGAPVLRHAWLDIDEPPPEWLSGVNSVAYLGDGRFCIHRRFDIMAKYGMESVSVDTVVLLTGVEVLRAGSRLRMIKHKSKRLDCDIESVL